MSHKIAVIASSINPIRQKHLLDWFEDISQSPPIKKLFLGSKNKRIPAANNYKINSKVEKLQFALLNIVLFRKVAPSLRKIQPLIRYKPDVIHLLTSNAFKNIEPYLKNNTCKVIISFRGFDMNVFPYKSEENKKLTKRILQKADCLHFVSEDLKNSAIRLGADPKKCVVIYRSIRIKEPTDLILSSTSLENKKPIILSVGRLVWEKGYLYGLETMALLKNKGYNFKYQIVGSGTDYNMLAFHIKRLKIQDYVELLGELSSNEVKQKLIEADIYFQPSVIEGIPNSIYEASYYKLPIVSSNAGGIPEVLNHGVSGYLSNPCNPEEYSENIAKLLDNKQIRIKIGGQAHKQILENFSREKEISKWNEIYKGLL